MKPKNQKKSGEAHLKRCIDKWRSKLGLACWRIDIDFADEDKASGAAADTLIKWPYKLCLITFYPHFWSMDENYREFSIVHELCHCLTNPLDELVYRAQTGTQVSDGERRDIRELVTNDVAQAIYYLSK